MERWQKIGSRLLGEFPLFRIRSDRLISPRTQQPHDFLVIDCANWVHVIATTPEQQVVMIEQYRQGTQTLELEIPGGIIDPDDASPVTAAERELREETGYAGENARLIGEVFPNPAIMSNTCYTVQVDNCRCCHPLELDHGEDLRTRLVPRAEVPKLVAAGQIRHALIIAALYNWELRQRQTDSRQSRAD